SRYSRLRALHSFLHDALPILLITHDMGVVAGFADRVLVMKESRMVELGTVDEIFYSPREKYTQDLLAAVPRVDAGEAGASRSVRSEEHTSELQSRENLVCRLL